MEFLLKESGPFAWKRLRQGIRFIVEAAFQAFPRIDRYYTICAAFGVIPSWLCCRHVSRGVPLGGFPAKL